MSTGRFLGGWSHLFCLVGRQLVPRDWRLQISEYNNAVIIEDIDIIPFIQWQGGQHFYSGIYLLHLHYTYIIHDCHLLERIIQGNWLNLLAFSYLPLNIKLQSLGNIKQPLPNLKPLDTFLHREEIQMLGGAFKCQ